MITPEYRVADKKQNPSYWSGKGVAFDTGGILACRCRKWMK
ncbi:MAG: hypothetical protein IPP36_07690 [Nitrosomonadales bacterium]|nr:hypothetical protein [Nitrosomonadales bacterium]